MANFYLFLFLGPTTIYLVVKRRTKSKVKSHDPWLKSMVRKKKEKENKENKRKKARQERKFSFRLTNSIVSFNNNNNN